MYKINYSFVQRCLQLNIIESYLIKKVDIKHIIEHLYKQFVLLIIDLWKIYRLTTLKQEGMAIKSVWLDESEDDCICCGGCEAICPEVFQVPVKMQVKRDVDYNLYEEGIKEAAQDCPTGAIKYDCSGRT